MLRCALVAASLDADADAEAEAEAVPVATGGGRTVLDPGAPAAAPV